MYTFDPVILSVTRVQAGSAANIIPERANVLGTIRTVSERARRTVRERVERMAQGIAAAHGLEVKVHILPGYPVTVNHADFTAFAQQVAGELLGGDRVVSLEAPIMGAEDFAYVLQRVPGALVFLGARPGEGESAPLHSNRMVLDEAAFADGIALHAAVAARWLAAH
jgi:hippurate hydrolase